jgi:hypothetical protein
MSVDKGNADVNGYKGKYHYHRYNPNSTGKKIGILDKNDNPVL